MPPSIADLIRSDVAYSGDKISVRSLEDTIGKARDRQNRQVIELKSLRQKNEALQEQLADEIERLRKFSDYFTMGKTKGGFFANLKEILSYIPIVGKMGVTKRSLEQLLRQQYELSHLRVKEAAEFADKLRAAEQELFEEIERLNEKIIESASNEKVAADFVLELDNARKTLEAELEQTEDGPERREKQADLDKLRRLESEHGGLLRLYNTSEERLGRLKENSRRLAETIGNLGSDISQYVQAAGEKLDLVAGQIQALGTAADASSVMLDMKDSLDTLHASVNDTTKFVSETQLFFRANIDQLMDDLRLFDQQTADTLEKNNAISREIEDAKIHEAVQMAQDARQVSAP